MFAVCRQGESLSVVALDGPAPSTRAVFRAVDTLGAVGRAALTVTRRARLVLRLPGLRPVFVSAPRDASDAPFVAEPGPPGPPPESPGLAVVGPDGSRLWAETGRLWILGPDDASPFAVLLPAEVAPRALAFDAAGEVHLVGVRTNAAAHLPVWLHLTGGQIRTPSLPLDADGTAALFDATGVPEPVALDVAGLPLVFAFDVGRLDRPRGAVVVLADAARARMHVLEEATFVSALRGADGVTLVFDDGRWVRARDAVDEGVTGDFAPRVRAALGERRGRLVVDAVTRSRGETWLAVSLEDPTELEVPLCAAILRLPDDASAASVVARAPEGVRYEALACDA
jgi:hypothetical protein